MLNSAFIHVQLFENFLCIVYAKYNYHIVRVYNESSLVMTIVIKKTSLLSMPHPQGRKNGL